MGPGPLVEHLAYVSCPLVVPTNRGAQAYVARGCCWRGLAAGVRTTPAGAAVRTLVPS